ncbi:MAG: adenine phosphoribosyltransferase [Elusimicrobia bacterium]|nr:MAG: adenine phosphoribosyltransferase [Elusimicrobiota bacterium]
MNDEHAAYLKKFIRDIPDFPKKGIVFKDITPLLKDSRAFSMMAESIAVSYEDTGITHVAVIESRGFLLGSAIASQLGVGVIPIRKKGKLPWKVHQASYELEYGTDVIEVHQDAAGPGDRVLIVDDVIATGGTAKAACELIEKLGAKVAGIALLIELSFLKGREKLPGRDVQALINY